MISHASTQILLFWAEHQSLLGSCRVPLSTELWIWSLLKCRNRIRYRSSPKYNKELINFTVSKNESLDTSYSFLRCIIRSSLWIGVICMMFPMFRELTHSLWFKNPRMCLMSRNLKGGFYYAVFLGYLLSPPPPWVWILSLDLGSSSGYSGSSKSNRSESERES